MRFERLNEAAFIVCLQVVFNGRWTCKSVCSLPTARNRGLFKVKNGSKRLGNILPEQKRSKLYLRVVAGQRHGAIGRAKIKSNSARLIFRWTHSHYYFVANPKRGWISLHSAQSRWPLGPIDPRRSC